MGTSRNSFSYGTPRSPLPPVIGGDMEDTPPITLLGRKGEGGRGGKKRGREK